MSTIDTLIQDIYSSLRNKEVAPGIDLAQVAQELGNEVETVFLETFDPDHHGHRTGLRLSGIGRCERYQWYETHDYEAEPVKDHVHITFMQGHILEALLKALTKVSGHQVSGEQDEHEVNGVFGHQDCIIDNQLVDIKTASKWSYDNKFTDTGIKGDDSFGYIPQLSSYGKVDGREHGYFFVMNKNNGELKLSKQELDTDVDKHIDQLKDKLLVNHPPMRIMNATDTKGKLSMQCGFCSQKHNCYGSLQATTYKSGAVSYYVDEVGGGF